MNGPIHLYGNRDGVPMIGSRIIPSGSSAVITSGGESLRIAVTRKADGRSKFNTVGAIPSWAGIACDSNHWGEPIMTVTAPEDAQVSVSDDEDVSVFTIQGASS